MRISLYLPLLLSLLAVRGVPMLGSRLAPAAATRVLSAICAAAAVGTVGGLALLTGAGLVHTREVLARGHLSPAQVAAADPVPKVFGPVGALLLLIVLLRIGRAVVHRCRTRRALAAVAHDAPGEELIVFTGTVPRAYAIPGAPGRIVVSDTMLRLLDGPGRRVLLAHERAHLIHHHHRYLACADLAVSVNPLLRRLRGHIAFQIERWADEDAARVVGDRRAAARSLARAALGSSSGGSTVLAFTEHAVTDRVRALIAVPTYTRLSWSIPAALAVLTGTIALVDAAWALARLALTLLG